MLKISFSMVRLILALSLLLFLIGFLIPGCSVVDETQVPHRAMINYYRGDYSLDDIDYKYFTHLIYIGIKPDQSGGIVLFDDSEAFTTRCLSEEVIPLYSLVNNSIEQEDGSSLQVYMHLYHQGLMNQFIENAVDMMIVAGFRGIDVDWEHPHGDEEKQVWNDMMKGLRLEMERRREETGDYYWLTTALPDWGADIPEPAVVERYIDYVNLMTYDVIGPWSSQTGNTAPLFADVDDPEGHNLADRVENWINAGFDPSRLLFGLAFYGYTWSGYEPFEKVVFDNEGNFPSGQSVDQGIGWKTARDREINEGWTKEFRPSSFSTWYFSPDRTRFVACDDEQVVAMKARWAKGMGLGGLFAWSLNLDRLPDGSTPLQEAAWQSWQP